jgi:hypothetical protein
MTRKLASVGLILYIVLLLTQPCQDVFAGALECHDTAHNFVERDYGSKSDCQAETCSPFCICTCCSMSVGNHDLAGSLAPQAFEPIAFQIARDHDNRATRSYQNSVWQPPKA